MVYLPTVNHKNQPNVGKYTSPMDPTGHKDPYQPTSISWNVMYGSGTFLTSGKG